MLYFAKNFLTFVLRPLDLSFLTKITTPSEGLERAFPLEVVSVADVFSAELEIKTSKLQSTISVLVRISAVNVI